MNIKNKTLKELKELCKKNNLKNYSKLDKINLIKFIKKNMKGGEKNFFNGILNRESLLMLLGKSDYQLKGMSGIFLINKNITKIEVGTFNGLDKLKVLDLSNNIILKIESCIFNGLNELVRLYLSGNYISKIEVGAFDKLNKLEELNLNKNRITKIELGVFNGLSKLTELNLRSNQITELEVGAFDRLSELKILDLSINKIAKIEYGTFNGLSELIQLHLQSNQITELEVGAFNGLNKLTYLNLRSNKITKIELGVFDGLSSIHDIYDDTDITKTTIENIRLYNKYYYLYQKIDSIEKNNKITNSRKIFRVFYNKLQLHYTILRNKTYGINGKDYTEKNAVTNNNYVNQQLLNTNGNEITNTSLKKYLIQKSKLVIESNHKNSLQLLRINENSIKVLKKYLEYKKLDDITEKELLILFQAFEYLDIQYKKNSSSLFEKIIEKIKDFNEEELIELFDLKRINNSKSLIKNNVNNKNCEKICKNKSSTVIENNNGSKCQCSISG